MNKKYINYNDILNLFPIDIPSEYLGSITNKLNNGIDKIVKNEINNSRNEIKKEIETKYKELSIELNKQIVLLELKLEACKEIIKKGNDNNDN